MGEWAPRLLPGAVGAATHGLIRTGHAVRALRRRRHTAPTAGGGERSGVLGLELPGAAGPAAADRPRRSCTDALADLPYLPEDAPRAALISDRVAALDDIADEFEQAVASLGWTGGAVELLDQLAVGRGRGLPAQRRRRRGDRPPARRDLTAGLRAAASRGWRRRIVTPPSATSGRPRRRCTSPTTSTARPAVRTDAPPSADSLVDMAVASGDEHAIKLTEAALRSFGRSGDEALLLAAADACARL